ncbi:hypothetical protein GCM10007979_08960 [Nocardioides albus]|nr:hypothetical protein GCM10007979_08960 [Nocardioides albus]
MDPSLEDNRAFVIVLFRSHMRRNPDPDIVISNGGRVPLWGGGCYGQRFGGALSGHGHLTTGSKAGSVAWDRGVVLGRSAWMVANVA